MLLSFYWADNEDVEVLCTGIECDVNFLSVFIK